MKLSLEVEADRESSRKAIAECESRNEAYKSGEMGSSERLGFLDRIESKTTSPMFVIWDPEARGLTPSNNHIHSCFGEK